MRMKITEAIKTQYLRGERLGLKGHYKVTFSDALTGKPKEVIEQDNLITSAVADIIAKNICGLGNMQSLFPLRRLYGGVLVFQNALTETASNFLPPNDIQNPQVAHAGDAMNDTQSLLRGNPIFSDFAETDTSIKQVWGWDATHGNGTWGAISLCGGTMGNMGLKPFNDEFNPMSVIGELKSNTERASLDEQTAKKYPWSFDDTDGQTCKSVWIEGTTFKEYTMRHDFLKHGIMRGADTWQQVSVRTATIRAFTADKTFAFEDDNYYYVATVTSATGISIDKIAKTDMTVTQQNCAFADVALYTGSVYNGQSFRPFAFDYPYLYYPNSSRDHFYRLNIADNSDKDLLDGTMNAIDIGELPSNTSNGEQVMNPVVISSGLILGNNYIINGNGAYNIKRVRQIGVGTGSIGTTGKLAVIRKGAAMWGNALQTFWATPNFGQSLILNQMYLGSIANLSEPRAKSTSLTARVEYTLTEQT